MFNFLKRFIRKKRAQTLRFIRMYTEYTFTEYDNFFEPHYNNPKPEVKKENTKKP